MMILSAAAVEMAQMDLNMLVQMIEGWFPDMLAFGYKLLIAAIFFFLGRKLIRLVQKVVGRSFQKAELEMGVSSFLLSMISACLHGILIFMIAGQIGVDSASIIALLGSASLAIGLAVQGSLANFAGGVMILLTKPFQVGDYIISDTGEGTVSQIGLVYTTLMTMDNKSTVIPNGTLANSPMVNVTSQDKRRVDLKVGIGYQADLKIAKEIIRDLYENHPAVLTTEPIDVFVDELGPNSVILGARGWVGTDQYWSTRWNLTEQIKLAFDQAGIQIPYPQLDVHLKPQADPGGADT